MKSLIPFADYERIYRLIHGVLGPRAKVAQACIFFSLVGAALLEMIYKIPAKPVAGAAVFALSPDSGVITTFGRIKEGCLISDSNAFHCWVEAEGFVIDFMVPIFEQSMASSALPIKIPPKMFQRHLSEMSPSPADVCETGAFFLSGSSLRTKEILSSFGESAQAQDLAKAVLHWYKRPPKQLDKDMVLHDDLGNAHRVSLGGASLVGVW